MPRVRSLGDLGLVPEEDEFGRALARLPMTDQTLLRPPGLADPESPWSKFVVETAKGMVPSTPLDFGLMAATAPIGIPGRVGAAALGMALQPSEAQAGTVRTLSNVVMKAANKAYETGKIPLSKYVDMMHGKLDRKEISELTGVGINRVSFKDELGFLTGASKKAAKEPSPPARAVNVGSVTTDEMKTAKKWLAEGDITSQQYGDFILGMQSLKELEGLKKTPQQKSMTFDPHSTPQQVIDQSKGVYVSKPGKDFTYVDEDELPRQVPFGVSERGRALGYNVPLAHGTTASPKHVPEELRGKFPFQEDFGQFELPSSEIGIHAGSPRAALSFTHDREGGRTFPLVGKAQNPLEMSDLGSWGPFKIQNELIRRGFDAGEVKAARWRPGKTDIENLRDFIREKGYDSIKYVNTVEDPGHTSYIFLNPSQLRVPWAKFDPAKAESGDLLSGLVGGGVVGGATLSNLPMSWQGERR